LGVGLVSAYGINTSFPLSQGKPFGPFEPFGGLEELGVKASPPGSEDFPKGFPEVFSPDQKPFGDFEADAKGSKGLKGFTADKGVLLYCYLSPASLHYLKTRSTRPPCPPQPRFWRTGWAASDSTCPPTCPPEKPVILKLTRIFGGQVGQGGQVSRDDGEF
jgi:hypothetical protein